MTDTDAGLQAVCTPSAQRAGSVALAKAARPPTPFSAGLGARKPLAQVARSASSRRGFHLTPTFGVQASPTSVKWS